MSFQVPRRAHFPGPVGDNSPHTPPDPAPRPVPPPELPPGFSAPSPRRYTLARDKWEQTGSLEALWLMQDNVSLTFPPPAAPLADEVPPPPSRNARAYRYEIAAGALAVSGAVFLVLDLVTGNGLWWMNLVTFIAAGVAASSGRAARHAR